MAKPPDMLTRQIKPNEGALRGCSSADRALLGRASVSNNEIQRENMVWYLTRGQNVPEHCVRDDDDEGGGWFLGNTDSPTTDTPRSS
jgi:hypothetical protein